MDTNFLSFYLLGIGYSTFEGIKVASVFKGFQKSCIAVTPSFAFPALRADQIANFLPATVAGITQVQMARITLEAAAGFTAEQVAQLDSGFGGACSGTN